MILVIIDRRELVRQFLNNWIANIHQSFAVTSIADAEASMSAEDLAKATMLIIGIGVMGLSDPWFNRQINWIRSGRPDVPIIAILDVDEDVGCSIPPLDNRLQGYISTSSSIGVAAAAVQLVAAGGVYFPGNARTHGSAARVSLPYLAHSGPHHDPSHSFETKLTPRERAVLELLEQGMANKIIAYRLSLSQSTVKAHVHNIISKLNVSNRTEAAVRGRTHISAA